MSGDRGPQTCLAGVVRALHDDAQLEALLVGDSSVFDGQVPDALRARIELVQSSQIVAMDDSPREAIRRKKNSSMRVAIDLVKDGRASACVSAGNTGALSAMAHFVLKTIA